MSMMRLSSSLCLLFSLLIAISVAISFWLIPSQCQVSKGQCEGSIPDDSPQVREFTFQAKSLSSALPANRSTSVLGDQNHPVRILLGISSLLYTPVEERQRRHLIRNTYLDFDRLHRPEHPARVCTLNFFLENLPFQNHHCQLIYTFVLGPTNGTVSDRPYQSVLDRSLFDNHETDVIFLNVAETDAVGKRWGWLAYADSIVKSDVHYAAFTDCHLMMKPSNFWEQNKLLRPGSSTPTEKIYAGLYTAKTKCATKKCVSLLGEYVMRRFVMLSMDLVHYVSKQPIPILGPTDSPDVAIANALYAYPHAPIMNVTIQGLVAKTSDNGGVGDFLSVFDRYKDSLVNYEDLGEVARVHTSGVFLGKSTDPPRLLLGIFTMDSSLEKEYRETIRKTYLSAFRNSETPDLICSLQQLDSMEDERKCQIAYVFVVGANPRGPKELVEPTDETGPLTLDTFFLADEPDVVYLNIQENGKEGKSQTFFKFGTMVLDRHYFDYLGKTDTDTLLYPKSFIENSLNYLPKFPRNTRVYAGDYRIKPSKETLNLGPAYMGGHFYLMSPDLSRYITSRDCNRSSLAVYSEDQSMGNFVHSMPKPIQRIRIKTFHFDHPVKRVDRMRTLWKKRQGKAS